MCRHLSPHWQWALSPCRRQNTCRASGHCRWMQPSVTTVLVGCSATPQAFPHELVIALILSRAWPGFCKPAPHLAARSKRSDRANLPLLHRDLNVDRVKMMAFAISGGFAGIAGLMFSVKLSGGDANLANGFLLLAIVAVLVGGTPLTGGVGGVVNTTIGTLIVMVIRAAMVYLESRRHPAADGVRHRSHPRDRTDNRPFQAARGGQVDVDDARSSIWSSPVGLHCKMCRSPEPGPGEALIKHCPHRHLRNRHSYLSMGTTRQKTCR